MNNIKNLFREFSMKSVKGYHELTSLEKECFDTIYSIHLSTIKCYKLFKEHTDQNIVKVEKHYNKNCLYLYVYFKTGRKYKYNLSLMGLIDDLNEFEGKKELESILIKSLPTKKEI